MCSASNAHYTWCCMKRSTLTTSFDPNVNPLRPSYYPQVKARDGEALAQSTAQPTGLSVPGPGLLQGSSPATLAGCPGRRVLVLTDMGSSQQRPSTSGWCSWREGPGTRRVSCCLPPPAPFPAKHSQGFRATGLREAEVPGVHPSGRPAVAPAGLSRTEAMSLDSSPRPTEDKAPGPPQSA